MKQAKHLDPIHPGEILLEDFMKPLGIRVNQHAGALARVALGRAAYFRVSSVSWPGLQIGDDLRMTRQGIGGDVDRPVREPPSNAASPSRQTSHL